MALTLLGLRIVGGSNNLDYLAAFTKMHLSVPQWVRIGQYIARVQTSRQQRRFVSDLHMGFNANFAGFVHYVKRDAQWHCTLVVRQSEAAFVTHRCLFCRLRRLRRAFVQGVAATT